jgi:hypothetical protein
MMQIQQEIENRWAQGKEFLGEFKQLVDVVSQKANRRPGR